LRERKMPHREPENPDPVLVALRLPDPATGRIPEEFKIQRIRSRNGDLVPLSGQAGRNFVQMYLSPAASRPVALDDVQNAHTLSRYPENLRE
ncbi:MAG: hypothetical protein NZ821_10025, partial [Gloeomargarita sp. SKYB31]|nr:hypothetical protein [Gloeomargarita sp. SKYB31]